jgi:hypothetical protein
VTTSNPRLHSQTFRAHPASAVTRISVFALPAIFSLRIVVSLSSGDPDKQLDFDLRSEELRPQIVEALDSFEVQDFDVSLNAFAALSIIEWLVEIRAIPQRD